MPEEGRHVRQGRKYIARIGVAEIEIEMEVEARMVRSSERCHDPCSRSSRSFPFGNLNLQGGGNEDEYNNAEELNRGHQKQVEDALC